MRVVVAGAGAVGSFLAARLHRSREVRSVVLITRRKAEVESVIRLDGGFSDQVTLARYDWEGFPGFDSDDVVLVACKAREVEALAAQLKRARGASAIGAVFLCQNGLGIVEEAEKGWRGPTYGRLVLWYGTRKDSGDRLDEIRVHVAGGTGVDLAGARDEVRKSLARILPEVGIPVLEHDRIDACEWRKVLWNASMNAVCALAQGTNGDSAADPRLAEAMGLLVEECAAVARAEGVRLSPTYREDVFKAARASGANHNSMRVDLREGRLTEMPWLNGAVARIADRHGIAAPLNRLLHAIVSFREGRRADQA